MDAVPTTRLDELAAQHALVLARAPGLQLNSDAGDTRVLRARLVRANPQCGVLPILIERIEAKWKVSRNRPQAYRAGVAAALREGDDPDARPMAKHAAAGGPSRS
jgi:predicted FMN-binding regulatory protein PaiB